MPTTRKPTAQPSGGSTAVARRGPAISPRAEERPRSAPIRIAKGKPDPRGTCSHEAIALRAYQFFLDRGGSHGHDLEDWERAERELRAVQSGH